MIVQYMGWDAVQQAKAALPNVYRHYYRDPDNAWMKELWGENVFVPFREVPDLHLADLRTSDGKAVPKGQVDLENCKRVYEALREHITPAEASQETLWAGLCNGNFYSYMRRRWRYDSIDTHDPREPGRIETRFFFGGSSAGVYRNTLGKCWWISHLLYDDTQRSNPYRRLDALGARDFSTKATDIFYNYGYARNRRVLAGVVLGIERCREQGIDIDSARILRPALRHLNAVGGLVLLDSLEEDEIADILIDGARIVPDSPAVPLEEDDDPDGELLIGI